MRSLITIAFNSAASIFTLVDLKRILSRSQRLCTEVDPTSWTGLRVGQARAWVLLAMIPVLVPVNFSFPSIPPRSIHGFVAHLGQGPGIHRASWDELAGRFWDGEAAELQARRRVVRLQLGRSTLYGSSP